jgi:phosphopantetheinyl transferase
VAVTRDTALGVDIERPRPIAECDLVAKRHFSRAEYAGLQQLPRAARARLVCTARSFIGKG